MKSQPYPAGSTEASELFLPDLRIAIQTFAVHTRTVAPGWSYGNHFHPMFELNMVLQGTQMFRVDGEEYVMEAGDLALLKPDARHGSVAGGGEGMTYCCIHFELDEPLLRQSLCSVSQPIHRAGSPVAAAVRPTMQSIFDSGQGTSSGSEAQRWEVLSLVFGMLSSFSALLSDAPDGLLSGPQSHAGLAEQIARLLAKAVQERRHMDEDSLAASAVARICGELGYSMAYCNRVFKSVFHMSPRQYLSMLKLREAKLLLLNRSLSIEEIAVKLGYKELSQFSKQFKRWMNLSPSQYRGMITH